MFAKSALTRHWDRLVVAGIGEWRGTWTRYQMLEGRLQAAPAFSAVCALSPSVVSTSGVEHSAIAQTNTYYEGADAPRIVPMPVLTADSFCALPSKNSLIVLPDTGVAFWSTLDFSSRQNTAAVELICRFRSRRARAVLLYMGDPDGVQWRLDKFTSIRDALDDSPFPESKLPGFCEQKPASSPGWTWTTNEVKVATGDVWAADLPESSASGSLEGVLLQQLDVSKARADVPEPDLLVHAPDTMAFDGSGAKTSISLTWSAEKDTCVRASLIIDPNGKLSTLRSSHWRHLP